MKNSLKLILLISVLSSCNFIDDDYSVIPNECLPFIEDFFKISESKGISIDHTYLKIQYVKFNDLRIGCASLSNNLIKIDTSSMIWKQNPEALLFHELGHLYLHRDHNDEYFEDNIHVKSIMNSNNLPVYSHQVCNICIDQTDYRKYYIDELFNPKD